MELEIDYAEPGPLTGLEGFAPEVLEGIGDDPVQVCMPVHLLVVQPDAAKELGLAEARRVRAISVLRPGFSARC